MRGNEKGFTLIELILVVAILGMLAVAVAPQVGIIMDAAENRTADATVGMVQDGINTFNANSISQNGTPLWPAVLDASPNGLCSQQGCFGAVISQPVFSASWRKDRNTQYTYIPSANTFTYQPNDNGTFE